MELSFSKYNELYDLLIPKDNQWRRMKEEIDFSFVNDYIEESYSKDMGRTAVERRAQNQDTYYIYDQYGQLRCVLPPAASIQFTTTGQPVSYNSDVIKRYAYLYSYDNKGRCVEKKLPGCEPQRFYYDKNDRLTFMDDGNLRDKNRMRFYLYDKFVCVEHFGNVFYEKISGKSKESRFAAEEFIRVH